MNNVITITVSDETGTKELSGFHEVDGFKLSPRVVIKDRMGNEVTADIDKSVGDVMSALANFSSALADNHSNLSRPDTIRALCEAFVESANTNPSLDDQDYLFEAMQRLDPTVFGQIIMQKIGEYDPDGASVLTREAKIEACDLAEALGPDWAQVFYHFAVLVTKLT